MELTQDQIEFRDLIRTFFAENVSSEYVRSRIESSVAVDSGLWRTLEQLGLNEGFCGADAPFGVEELSLVAEESGASLLPEPLWERLMCGGVFPRLLPAGEQQAYRTAINGKETAIAPREACTLKCDAKGKGLSGDVAWCFGGAGAGRVVAVAQAGSQERVVVFDVEGDGVTAQPHSSLDLTARLVGFSLKKAACCVLSEGASRLFLQLTELMKAAEVYGITRRVIDVTCEYVKTREQFGVPVGGFQAVQQKLADAYATSEALIALVRFAAWSIVASPEQRALTTRAAISYASQVGPSVCEVAMQCHGGIGFTWEYDLHLYLRRVKVIEMAFPHSEARARELITLAGQGRT